MEEKMNEVTYLELLEKAKADRSKAYQEWVEASKGWFETYKKLKQSNADQNKIDTEWEIALVKSNDAYTRWVVADSEVMRLRGYS